MNDRLSSLTSIASHPPFIRDVANLRSIFNLWLLALLPCVLVGLWNTGFQASRLLQSNELVIIPGWRGSVLQLLGNPYQTDSFWANLVHGSAYFFPILLAAFVTIIFWEAVFARLRGRKIVEGAVLFSVLFSLILPPSIPLWQVVVGMSFAVVIGKEVFGGTGLYLVHPVLAGRAFLYFAYPDQLTGESIWTVVDATVGAAPLDTLKSSGLEGLAEKNVKFIDAFMGQIPGSFGETSTLAVILGAALLLWTRVVSWRIITGSMAGLFITTLLLNSFGNEANALAELSWSWHVVLGGFAFGLVFIATDPVTSPQTNAGRWVYGALIGMLLVLIRVSNPAMPEGMMFAILLANALAPLIDHAVVKLHIRRRMAKAGVETGADTYHD